MADFTVKNLEDVEDSADGHGFGPALQARFAHDDLGCAQTGVSLQRLAPGARMPFAHRHAQAEEVYVVLSGSGRLLVDGEEVGLRRLDAVRLGPEPVRTLAAGPDGLEILAFGPRHEGDVEPAQAEWPSGP